ncbi:hypothetical protein [Halorussus halophilus]|uniref:hypothetical protein n=1 Tax=Halorussus halophilus TaxID=2650975 RepID=UPI0013011678|nr:hypothetical protein [Halorussus halophilus]
MGYTWQYYDLVLGAILLTMVSGVGIGYATTVAIPTAVTGAGFVAAALIGHGLFVNGPVDEPSDLTNEVDTLN